MVREDLITSAVSCMTSSNLWKLITNQTPVLQDPSVANAPVEKRIAFLQSKNLTQEEIDVSLARAASDDPSQAVPQYSAPPSNAYRPPPAAPAYGSGYPPQYWPQQPPPEYVQTTHYSLRGI